jgi:hypothetical protein
MNAQVGFAGGAYGTILKTTNGGTTWVAQASGTDNPAITSIWFTSAATAFMTCSDGRLLRTVNAGLTWHPTFCPGPLASVHFPTLINGWAVGANGLIKFTTDGGETWFPQPSGTTRNLNGVCFANADTGWAVGDGGTIIWTTNGGASWGNQISGTTSDLHDVQFLSSKHGYAVGANNTIIEYAVVHSLPIQLSSFTATLLNNHSVRLDWRTISEINNFGFEVQRRSGVTENFETLVGSFVSGHGTTNEPQIYSWIDHAAPSGRLYYRLKQIDLDGTINYTEPITIDVVTGVKDGAIAAQFMLKQNYPNPFNPTTNIEFSVAQSGFVSLKVYDILGREVATIVSETLNQGSHMRTFSGESLSSGVYWYKLTSGSFTQTKKFVLSR